MNALPAIGFGLAGAVAGVPLAAIAYGLEESGPVRVPERWWIGGAARPSRVIATVVCAGVASAVVGAGIPSTVSRPSYWIFAIVGVGLAIIDARCRRLPHILTGLLLATSTLGFALAAVAEGEVQALVRAAALGIATAAIVLGLALAMPGQLGLGDVGFVCAIAFSLGWLGLGVAAFGILAGLILHGVFAASQRILQYGEALQPLGPALLVGWLLAVAVGP